jgi:hypothetical protein
MTLSEAEVMRLRAEVHAAMVARRYDLARAKLQELAQRSRDTWPGPTPPSLGRDAPPRWLREVAAGLLLSLIAAGVVLVGGSGLAEGYLRLFAAGAWLIMFGLGVTALLVGWRLLRSARD